MRGNRQSSFLDVHWRIGRLFDVPINIHLTLVFFLIPAIAMSKSWGPWLALEFSALMVLSILLHELGHALVAKRYRMGGLSIMLHGFGGFATSSGYRTPKQALMITLAGPAVTFVIGTLCWLMAYQSMHAPEFPSLQMQLIHGVGLLNLWLGLFNLIPSQPFDGGHAAVALLNYRWNEFKAHRFVGHLGLIATPVLLGVGFYFDLPYAPIFAIIGFLNSYMYLAQTGGVKFNELWADRKRRKEEAAYKAKREAESQAYLGRCL
ncbi:MAG: site-2 protease family protein [Fimbriimonadaceae bacterium]